MKQIIALLSVLVVVLVATNAWTLSSNYALQRELDTKQAKLQKVARAAKAQKGQKSGSATKAAKNRGSRTEATRRKKAKAPRSAPEPKGDARDRFRDAMLNNRLDAVVELAHERGWSDDVAADVVAVFEETNGVMSAVREDVGTGDLAPEDGREEMTAIREGVADELIAILGDDEYQVFRDRIWGNGADLR